jgi:hypothetical protein
MAAEVGLGLSPEANTAKAGGVLVVWTLKDIWVWVKNLRWLP